MQLIHVVDMSPEQYVAEGFERRMRPPRRCPHCHRARTLWALGYYCRNLSRIGAGVLSFLVRRFRCRCCHKTVSLLPSFAQPYRFIQNPTIENYAHGVPFSAEVIRHLDLLSQYWKRFSIWLPDLKHTVGCALGRAPPKEPHEAWAFLLAKHGDLASTTQHLVSSFQITLFGRYRCHRPNRQEEKRIGKE